MIGRFPLLLDLREQTRAAHQRLEEQALLRNLLSPELEMKQYIQVLQIFHAFYEALEKELLPALHVLRQDYPEFRHTYSSRIRLLQLDLADLGEIPRRFNNTVLRDERLRSLSSGRALGVLYVLEGATQGGRLISEFLASSLGLSSKHGARYFNLHRQEDSWSAFCKELGLIDDESLDSLSAVDGAQATFTELYTHFNAWQRHLNEG